MVACQSTLASSLNTYKKTYFWAHLGSGNCRLIFGLADCPYMDSAGLGTMMTLLKDVQGKGSPRDGCSFPPRQPPAGYSGAGPNSWGDRVRGRRSPEDRMTRP